jgi:hypothetical protein
MTAPPRRASSRRRARGIGGVVRRSAWLAFPVALAACAGLRHSPATRYDGIVLDARNLGASRVDAAIARDPAVAAWVRSHGRPDYVYESGRDLELIYYEASRLAHFHRDPETGRTVVGELSPLPTPLVNVLPLDIRAGTPGPIDADEPGPPLAQCWTVPVGNAMCRTCCRTSDACSTQCGG